MLEGMFFWLSNGELSYYRLFKQYLLLVLLNQMGTALYRCIAAIGRTLVVANKCGSFALLILFALGGFVLSRGKNCNLNFFNPSLCLASGWTLQLTSFPLTGDGANSVEQIMYMFGGYGGTGFRQ